MSNSKIISMDHPDSQSIAIDRLMNNGVIAIPTDTVYGIACLAFSTKAIERIFSIKHRDSNKALPILIGSITQLNQIAQSIGNKTKKLISEFWPGPLTLIVNRKPCLPEQLSPYPTIGVRMPNHTWLIELIKKVGPLATTSANLSGKSEARNVMEINEVFGKKIDLIIDGGQSSMSLPSTVVDCSGFEMKILREGAIKSATILQILQ
jgi:L-threonylcarbamoyladenylate synthase